MALKYAEVGQKEKAEEILSQILQMVKTGDARWKANVLSGVASKYAGIGQKEKAQELLSQSLQLAMSIKYEDDKIEALARIPLAYAETGKKLEEPERQILHKIIASISPGSKTAKSEELIIGKWGEIGGTEIMEFFRGGTVSVVSGGMSMGGNYQFLNDDRIRFEFGGLGALAGPMVYRVSITKNQLYLTDPKGDVSRY